MGVTDYKDRKINIALKKMAEANLCLKEDEKLLIINDVYETDVGLRMFDILKNYVKAAVHFTYFPTGRHGIEPSEDVWLAVFGEDAVGKLKEEQLLEKILRKEIKDYDETRIIEILKNTKIPDVVVAVNKDSISHTFFRKLCNTFGARFASMPLFEEFMFYTAMQADWKEVERRSVAAAEVLSSGTKVRIVSEEGTDILMDIDGRQGIADTGRICNSGTFGNLPAGEAFIAPNEGTTEGVFVTNWAPDRKLKESIKFYVNGGKVAEVEGDKDFVEYLKSIFEKEENRNIAELGIGTNGKAVKFSNILEGEKILGTCHIAIGDNSAFGGKVRANVHIDFIVEKLTLVVELKNGKEKVVIDKGKFVL